MRKCPICGCTSYGASRDIERRRIRRAIAPHLGYLRTLNANDFGKRIQAVAAVDRATKPPKGELAKGESR